MCTSIIVPSLGPANLVLTCQNEHLCHMCISAAPVRDWHPLQVSPLKRLLKTIMDPKGSTPHSELWYLPQVLAGHAQHKLPALDQTIELIRSLLLDFPNHQLLICGSPLMPRLSSQYPANTHTQQGKISRPFINGRVGDQGIGIQVGHAGSI